MLRLDEELLALPFGEEWRAEPLLRDREAAVQRILAGPVDEDGLRTLQTSTAYVREHFAHSRRRIAAEAGEAGSHQRFLSALQSGMCDSEESGRLLA